MEAGSVETAAVGQRADDARRLDARQSGDSFESFALETNYRRFVFIFRTDEGEIHGVEILWLVTGIDFHRIRKTSPEQHRPDSQDKRKTYFSSNEPVARRTARIPHRALRHLLDGISLVCAQGL